MRNLRTPAASLIAALSLTVLLAACGSSNNDDLPTGAERDNGSSDSVRSPGNDQGISRGGTGTNKDENTEGGTDSSQSAPAVTTKGVNPCTIVSKESLNKAFDTETFQPSDTTNPKVIDQNTQQRACGYSGTDAYISVDASRYSRIDLTVTITTYVDTTGTGVWKGMQDFGGRAVNVKNTEEALRLSTGNYAARKDGIVFQVESPYGELNDDAALKILAIAANSIH